MKEEKKIYKKFHLIYFFKVKWQLGSKKSVDRVVVVVVVVGVKLNEYMNAIKNETDYQLIVGTVRYKLRRVKEFEKTRICYLHRPKSFVLK